MRTPRWRAWPPNEWSSGASRPSVWSARRWARGPPRRRSSGWWTWPRRPSWVDRKRFARKAGITGGTLTGDPLVLADPLGTRVHVHAAAAGEAAQGHPAIVGQRDGQ